MSTTLRDFGRQSDRFGEIGFYYAFKIKFWFGQSMLMPDDVLTWCRENCTGYYKVMCYTHKSSKRNQTTGFYDEKIVFVDKIYLASEEDATMIRLAFDVRDVKVMRERMPKRVRAMA